MPAVSSRSIGAWLAPTAHILLIVVAVAIALFPFVNLFMNGIKQTNEFVLVPPLLFPRQPTLQHYEALISDGDTPRYLVNSLIITAATTVVAVSLGSLAAYSLARLQLPFRLSLIIAFAFLVVRFYPKIATTIPYFVLMREFKLLDTHLAVIIAHVSITLPFVVWLMLTFFEELPPELERSAMLDGCGPLRRFVYIVLPLTTPALLTTAILTALVSWNEFLIASSLAPNRAKTLPIAVSGFITDQGIQWGPMAAMSTIIVVPVMIFALFVQRYLVRGLTLGAVKE